MTQEILQTMVEDIGSLVQGLESMMINMYSGIAIFFTGLFICGVIFTLIYVLKKSVEVSNT